MDCQIGRINATTQQIGITTRYKLHRHALRQLSNFRLRYRDDNAAFAVLLLHHVAVFHRSNCISLPDATDTDRMQRDRFVMPLSHTFAHITSGPRSR